MLPVIFVRIDKHAITFSGISVRIVDLGFEALVLFCPDWYHAFWPKFGEFCPDRDQASPGNVMGPHMRWMYKYTGCSKERSWRTAMVDHPNPVVPSWYIRTLDGNKRYPTKGVGVSGSSGGTPWVQIRRCELLLSMIIDSASFSSLLKLFQFQGFRPESQTVKHSRWWNGSRSMAGSDVPFIHSEISTLQLSVR